VAGAVDLFDVEAAVRRVKPRPELVVCEREGLEVWVREECGCERGCRELGVRAERWWRLRRARRLRRIREA
jgi:hypothetical protein